MNIVPRNAPPDQCPELRALQGVRHQVPGAEHRLGRARAGRRAQLQRHVTRGLHLFYLPFEGIRSLG